MADVKDAPVAEPGAPSGSVPQTTGAPVEIGKLTADFREMLDCATREIERRWAGKAAQFVMDTQKQQGGEILFPDQKTFDPVGWPLKNYSGPSSVLKTLEEWLLPEEFVIIAGVSLDRTVFQSCYEFTAYTNFARIVWWGHTQAPCLGLCYEGREYSPNQYGAYLNPRQPGRRCIRAEDDKGFPLTLHQCKILVALVGKDTEHWRAHNARVDWRQANTIWQNGGEPLVETVLSIFKESAEQPALYQLAVEKKALEAARIAFTAERAELEAEKARHVEKVRALDGKTQLVQGIIEKVNEEKQDALQLRAISEGRARTVIEWLQAAQGFDSLQMIQFALANCISELGKGSKGT